MFDVSKEALRIQIQVTSLYHGLFLPESNQNKSPSHRPKDSCIDSHDRRHVVSGVHQEVYFVTLVGSDCGAS